MRNPEQFLEEAFGSAAPEHFEWQTVGAFVSDRERELVRAAFLPLGKRLLDLGCAEGATLYHLGAPDGAVGVDLFEDKLSFARRRLPNCRFVAGSAYQLPFPDESFDHIIVRDVIHHIDEPARALDECRRVLAPGGRIDVLEPCRYNPLILLHAVARSAERGELRSTKSFLEGIVSGAGFVVVSTGHHQALPIHRVLLHPEMGRPRLGNAPCARRILFGIESLAARLIPRFFWAYLHVRAVRSARATRMALHDHPL